LSAGAQDDEVIERLVRWAGQQPLVRAMLLTSSRAIPGAPADVLSDWDVILALRDVRPFFAERDWLGAFGRVLALYRDPLILDGGLERSGYVTQFEGGLKIDFSLWPVALLQRVVAEPQLPPEFDAGYQILLDKDHLTDGLKPPTYRAYIPSPPAEADYQATIECFFLDATYVAKFLWRDDVMAAKHILDYAMKQEGLRPMLEWHVETDHGWSVKPGPYGRGLKKWLRPGLWAQLERTYTGAGLEANWAALFETIALMRRVAGEVAERMGYRYPLELEQRVLAHIHKVKDLDPTRRS
jgi:aminoglycoside 6-adenylyltransferase